MKLLCKSNITGDELLLNIGAKLGDNKIAMATFRTSQCQDGDEGMKMPGHKKTL